MMHLVVIGISHKTAPVAVRERLALDEEATRKALTRLKEYTVMEEVVVLSTCNRIEIYAITTSQHHARLALAEFLKEPFGTEEDPSKFFYYKQEQEACAHLFAVTASLDSQVVGESQILGQVKKAYLLAVQSGAAGRVLTRVFEQALFVAHQVRAETGIGKGNVSVGSVGVQLVRKILGPLNGKTVVLLGAGEVGKLVVRHLNQEHVGETCIVNRTFAHAHLLEEQGLGKAYPIETLFDLLERADVFITSLDGHLIDLTHDQLNKVASLRQGRPLLVLDLGVPRNLSETSLLSPSLHVHNLDGLQSISDQNQQGRLKAIAQAKNLIDREVDVFYESLGFKSDSAALFPHLANEFQTQEGEKDGRKGTHQEIS